MNGPCAKTRVFCTLVTPAGEHIRGENLCDEPQKVCPRAPGEDYTKCKTVCKQVGHAETVALFLAGTAAKGSRAFIQGHTYACMDCQHKLFAAGVRSVAVGAPEAPERSPLKSVSISCPNGCKAGVEGKIGMGGFTERLRCLRCDARWLPV